MGFVWSSVSYCDWIMLRGWCVFTNLHHIVWYVLWELSDHLVWMNWVWVQHWKGLSVIVYDWFALNMLHCVFPQTTYFVASSYRYSRHIVFDFLLYFWFRLFLRSEVCWIIYDWNSFIIDSIFFLLCWWEHYCFGPFLYQVD